MADDPPPATALIDLAAVVISPILVALMVGSLVFFLTEVGYRGEYPGGCCTRCSSSSPGAC